MQIKSKIRTFYIIGIGLVLLAAAIIIPAACHVFQQTKYRQDLSNVRQLGVLLQQYANDHHGQYPASLDELCNLHMKQSPKWIYFPGHTVSDLPDTILLQSPDGKITYTVGNSVTYQKNPPRH